jgi:hypothetical protein
MTRATDDGGEHGTGGVISCEPGLAHTGSVVHNESSYIVIHDSRLLLLLLIDTK